MSWDPEKYQTDPEYRGMVRRSVLGFIMGMLGPEGSTRRKVGLGLTAAASAWALAQLSTGVTLH